MWYSEDSRIELQEPPPSTFPPHRDAAKYYVYLSDVTVRDYVYEDIHVLRESGKQRSDVVDGPLDTSEACCSHGIGFLFGEGK